MKISIILLALLFITSCGKKVPLVSRGLIVTSELEPYIQNFIDIAEDCYGAKPIYRRLTVGVEEDMNKKKKEGDKMLAYCSEWSNGASYIKVRRTALNDLHPHEVRRAIFHEMGHCYLGLDHNEENAMSIMYPYLAPYWAFDNYDEAYMNDLFGKEATCDLSQYNMDETPEELFNWMNDRNLL